MNCGEFQSLIGMRCAQIGAAVEVLTPFTFADGDGLELFAQSHGEQVLFFDEGLTFAHLRSVGVRMGADKGRWQPLKTIANYYGVTLSDSGVFELLCQRASASRGFAKMISALLGVAAWERENLGVSLDSDWLIDEVAMYLRAWKPEAKIQTKPEARGFSGRTLTFDFDMDGQLIDAISSHSASTGAELRKLIDLQSGPITVSKDVLVIVDDRADAQAAKREIGILGRVTEVWPMTKLMAASGALHGVQ